MTEFEQKVLDTLEQIVRRMNVTDKAFTDTFGSALETIKTMGELLKKVAYEVDELKRASGQPAAPPASTE
jgi:hypothetical protein